MTLHVPPPGVVPTVWLRREGEPPPKGGVRPRPEREAATKRERAIVCASCRKAITAEGARISVAGAHEHRFVNPHGFVYDVQCFRDAPGCEPVGPPTEEFTWFPGFAWSIAYCAGCATHLGWSFEGPGRAFYGLIKERIAVVEE